MKLIEITKMFREWKNPYTWPTINHEKVDIDSAIVEAELIERKAKAFDWLQDHDFSGNVHGLPKAFTFRGNLLEAIEAAMKK